MNRDNSLIKIFLLVSDFVKSYFEKNPMERNTSPNENYFYTDELMTVYLFGVEVGLVSVKEIHSYICSHYRDWFPKIPKYVGFNQRLNKVSKLFQEFSAYQISISNKSTDLKDAIQSIDSMPIIVSKKTRKKSKIKPDTKLNNGYCSSKDLHFFGAKLHLVVVNQEASLAKPLTFKVTPASPHDLTVAKSMSKEFKDCTLLGDKAYVSKKFKNKLLKQNVILRTPIKLTKIKKSYNDDELIYNNAISSRRQSVEIFFAWLIRKTKIQIASLIRSISGFTFFVYSRIALAIMLLEYV